MKDTELTFLIKKIAIFCVRLLDIEVKDIFPAIHFFLSDLL